MKAHDAFEQIVRGLEPPVFTPPRRVGKRLRAAALSAVVILGIIAVGLSQSPDPDRSGVASMSTESTDTDGAPIGRPLTAEEMANLPEDRQPRNYIPPANALQWGARAEFPIPELDSVDNEAMDAWRANLGAGAGGSTAWVARVGGLEMALVVMSPLQPSGPSGDARLVIYERGAQGGRFVYDERSEPDPDPIVVRLQRGDTELDLVIGPPFSTLIMRDQNGQVVKPADEGSGWAAWEVIEAGGTVQVESCARCPFIEHLPSS